MPMPNDIQAIDLMMGIPVSETNQEWYEAFKPLLMDEESRQMFKMPTQYMFRDIPKLDGLDDYLAFTVQQMDRHRIEVALVGFDDNSTTALAAQQRFPNRFAFDYAANPNRGMEEVRKIRRLHREHGIKAVSVFPCGTAPSPGRISP